MTVWVSTVAASAGLIAVLMLLSWGFRWLYRRLERWRGREQPLLAIQRWNILAPSEVVPAVVMVLRVVRVIVTIVVVDTYGSYVATLFGASDLFTRPLLSYLAAPAHGMWEAFVAYIPNLFHIVAVGVVLYVVLHIVGQVFRATEHGVIVIHGFHSDWARPTYNIVRLLLIALTAIEIFPLLPGSGSEYFQGISIFVGALLTLGSSGAVGNVMSGLVLIYTRAYQVGETVRIGEVTGTVTEKNMLVTRLRTPQNEEITIPNGIVLTQAVRNYSTFAKGEGLVLQAQVSVGYDIEWCNVHDLLLAAAARTDDVRSQPKPFVLQSSLDAISVQYVLNAYVVDAAGMSRIQSDLHRHILDAFREAGMELASPPVTILKTNPVPGAQG